MSRAIRRERARDRKRGRNDTAISMLKVLVAYSTGRVSGPEAARAMYYPLPVPEGDEDKIMREVLDRVAQMGEAITRIVNSLPPQEEYLAPTLGDDEEAIL